MSLVTPSTNAKLFAELLATCSRIIDRVLDDVVEQRGGNRLMVHLELGQNFGDGQRMLDVRLARGSMLALVGRIGELWTLISHSASAERS